MQLFRIFTEVSISPSPSPRQYADRYAICAGRNLPAKEFRYLRTVIVTAAVNRSFRYELCQLNQYNNSVCVPLIFGIGRLLYTYLFRSALVTFQKCFYFPAIRINITTKKRLHFVLNCYWLKTNKFHSPPGTEQASAPIQRLTTLRRHVFLVNSRRRLIFETYGTLSSEVTELTCRVP